MGERFPCNVGFLPDGWWVIGQVTLNFTGMMFLIFEEYTQFGKSCRLHAEKFEIRTRNPEL
jgi:hypothetical protein